MGSKKFPYMPSVLNMETKSPWSTPTESEILNAEDSALIKEKEDALFEEIDYTVNETFGKRELGDGEPSVDENLDGRRSTLPPSPTKSKSKKGLKNGVKERGRKNRSKSPASNKTRQKSISPTKKKRSPKIVKKKMDPPNMESEIIDNEFDKEVSENNERNKTATLTKDVIEDNYVEEILAPEENHNVSPVRRSTSKDSPKKKPNKKKIISKEPPSPTKQINGSPVKKRQPKMNRQTSTNRTTTASSGASGDSLKLGADYANMGDHDGSTRRISRPDEAGRGGGRMLNGRSSEDIGSANTNRSSSTATSGSTGGAVQTKHPSPPVSPKKSPAKSPKKTLGTSSPKKRMKDLLVLPMPYNDMSSDEVKRWEKTLSKGEEIDDEIYPEFSQIE